MLFGSPIPWALGNIAHVGNPGMNHLLQLEGIDVGPDEGIASHKNLDQLDEILAR